MLMVKGEEDVSGRDGLTGSVNCVGIYLLEEMLGTVKNGGN